MTINAKNKVGRPRKIVYKHPVVIEGNSKKYSIRILEAEVGKIKEVSKLVSTQKNELIDGLIIAMKYFDIAEKLRLLVPAKSKGNRNKVHEQILIADCARLWAKVTGQPILMWENAEDGVQSVSISLVRSVIYASTGKKRTASLQRQANKAKIISYQ